MSETTTTPRFYEIIASRYGVREFWWGSKNNPLTFVLAIVLFKILRLQWPNASDHAHVESTLPFQVESLSPELLEHFAPMAAELAAVGFVDPVYHAIDDPISQIRIYWATYRHPSGQYCARIHNRYWDKQVKVERAFFTQFFTAFNDGTFLLSSSGKPDTAEPPGVVMSRRVGVKLPELFSSHAQLLETRPGAKAIIPITSREDVVAISENLHLLQRDFHLRRGFFRERSAKELEKGREFADAVDKIRGEGAQHPEVIAEIINLEEKKPPWTNAIWILVISFLAFIAGSRLSNWNWTRVLWLIPILLFHETGHWLAMRAFGYRNLRMFFIPFFGAAVSGQHRNIAGWKKAMVSLAGPIPGILLGIICAIVASAVNLEWLRTPARLLIFINALNLAPVFPLDGGQFLQSTLFCRNRWLDVIFRIAAIAMLLLSVFIGFGRTMMYLGIVLATGLPLALKMSKVIDHFRRHPLPTPPPGDDRIPRPTAEAIISAVKTEVPKANNKNVAQLVLTIYETLNAHPPGILATVGLMAVYCGMIIVSILAFSFMYMGNIGKMAAFYSGMPRHQIALTSVDIWRGAEATDGALSSRNFVVSTFSAANSARQSYQQYIENSPPPNTVAILFGDSVIVETRKDNKDFTKKCLTTFRRQSTNSFLSTNNFVDVSISFMAPNSAASSRLQGTLEQFFNSEMTNLIPPWDPAAASPDFASFLEARREWQSIRHEFDAVWKDPVIEADTRKMLGLEGHVDTNNAAKFFEDEQKRARQLQDEASERLTARYAGTPYAALVKYQIQLNHLKNDTNEVERAQILAKVAAELGSYPANAFKADYVTGGASRFGLQFRLPFVRLSAPETTLPELVQWLAKQGCSHFYYDFIKYVNDDD